MSVGEFPGPFLSLFTRKLLAAPEIVSIFAHAQGTGRESGGNRAASRVMSHNEGVRNFVCEA